jgi:hypothetical protein
MNQVDEELWSAGISLPFNGDSAIYKYWVDQRNQGNYLGLPATAEIQVGDNPACWEQGFTNGQIVGFNQDTGIYTR